MYDLGDTLPFSAKLYDKDPNVDPTAVLVDPTSVVLTITNPDGTTTTPSPVHPGVGLYTYDMVTTTILGPGRYTGRWVFTMSTGKTTVTFQSFYVEGADPGLIITLEEARSHLNIPANDTKSDEEIRDWIAAVTGWLESRVGICVPKTFTEVYDPMWSAQIIHLRHAPVMSVTTVVPFLTYGIAYPVNGLIVNGDAGTLYRLNSFGWVGGPFTITYRAGRTVIPAQYRAAARIMLQGLWETQRGPSNISLQGGADISNVPGMGLIVARAEALLDIPGFMVGVA